MKRREKAASSVEWLMPAGLMELLSSGKGPEVFFSCATLTFKMVKLSGKRGGNWQVLAHENCLLSPRRPNKEAERLGVYSGGTKRENVLTFL